MYVHLPIMICTMLICSDLNCGCPKPFSYAHTHICQTELTYSTHSGMGAALLSTPDLLLNILRKLLDNIPLPISCKIRMLPTQPSTLVLVSRILRTGIRNLTVHCRTRNMRPGERAMWERLGDIVDLGRRRGVPVTCNGDGDGWTNWERIRSETSKSAPQSVDGGADERCRLGDASPCS